MPKYVRMLKSTRNVYTNVTCNYSESMETLGVTP